jgi:hypothetical protein
LKEAALGLFQLAALGKLERAGNIRSMSSVVKVLTVRARATRDRRAGRHCVSGLKYYQHLCSATHLI